MERKKTVFENHLNTKGEVIPLGDLLRRKRQELNLTLKEAENATSIRISYLQALEEGEMNKLISPIYAQGFLKQYASYLGLDGEQMIRDHQAAFIRPESQEFNYGIGTLEMRGNLGANVKWLPNFIWILAFLAVCVAGWYLAKAMGVI